MRSNAPSGIGSTLYFAVVIALFLLASAASCLAQAVPPVRGVYTPGLSATNSGVLPGPGLTYANYFMNYSFDQFRTAKGDTIFEHGNADVLLDINVFIYVTKFCHFLSIFISEKLYKI